MPREVTRANSKTTTQIARSHINVIFSGQWSKKAYVWLQNHFCVSRNETQETLRVIITSADTADLSTGRYTSHRGLSVKYMSPAR